jgi:hypothetical protein
MPKASSATQVLKKIKCEYLSLYKGEGYWYFIFDNGTTYESESIMVIRMNDMTVEQWVDAGEAFLERCKKIEEDRINPNYKNMTMIFKNIEKGE